MWMLEHVTYCGLSLQIIQGQARGGGELGNINNFDGKFLKKIIWRFFFDNLNNNCLIPESYKVSNAFKVHKSTLRMLDLGYSLRWLVTVDDVWRCWITLDKSRWTLMMLDNTFWHLIYMMMFDYTWESMINLNDAWLPLVMLDSIMMMLFNAWYSSWCLITLDKTWCLTTVDNAWQYFITLSEA